MMFGSNSPPTVEDQMFVPIANDFDPTVSGLPGKVGAIAFSSDGTKSWRKFGAVNTLWVPHHETTATLTGPRSTIACSDFTTSLSCDTLGGFVWTIQGSITRPGAAPNLYFTFHHTGAVPSGNKMRGLYNGDVVKYANSAILWSIATGTFRVTVEAYASEINSTNGTPQMVRVTTENGAAGVDSQLFIMRTGSASEVTNPGLILDTGATFDAGCKVSLRR